MEKLVLIITILLCTSLTYGQIIKIQGGLSISSIDWELKNINASPIFDDNLLGYSIFAGIDYMDNKYYNLSSNIGLIKKGGKDELQLVDADFEFTGDSKVMKPTLEYLTLNTLFEVKYSIKEIVSPFISFGPRIDYLVKSSKEFDSLEEMNELKSISIGMILGGGLKYDFNKIQFGIRYDYNLNFNKIAEWKVETSNISGQITDNTFTINMTIGYKL